MTLPEEDVVLPPACSLFEPPSTDVEPAELTQSYERLHLIYETGLSLFSATQLPDVLSKVIDGLCKLVNVERCFLATFDDGGTLHARSSHNIDLEGGISNWPVSRSVITRVLEEGSSLLSVDTQQDKTLSASSSVLMHQIRSVMCTPLGPPNSCIGIIYADSRIRSGSFSAVDLKLLTALAHFSYLAIRNASELDNAHHACELSDEHSALLQRELFAQHRIVGQSPLLMEAYDRAKRAAAKEVPILIQGESGTGKELFARAAHAMSLRADKPFIAVHLAETNENLIESELFGHEKGSFTGAHERRIGKFELVRGGTIFLDEVAEIPLTIQAKLLRILETQAFERVGGDEAIHTDFRLVCATHQDLETMVREGTFREDLYYRLVGVNIPLPPLRDRPGDIKLLVDHILEKLQSQKQFSEPAMRQLNAYPWPGNVRQLVRVVEAVDALCDDDWVGVPDLPPPIRPAPPLGADGKNRPNGEFSPLKETIARVEKEHYREALARSSGNKEAARELLGVSKDTFWKRLKVYEL